MEFRDTTETLGWGSKQYVALIAFFHQVQAVLTVLVLLFVATGSDRWDVHRQEVPIHRERLDQRSHLERVGCFNKDEQNDHHEKRLPALCKKVQEIRETTYQHSLSHVPLFLREGR